MAVIALTASISGCASALSKIDADYAALPEVCSTFTSGKSVEKISAEGALGTKPKVTIAA
ncbi:MAG: hypothetical protein RLZ06_921, partial [Actinomycetota bacterium]